MTASLEVPSAAAVAWPADVSMIWQRLTELAAECVALRAELTAVHQRVAVLEAANEQLREASAATSVDVADDRRQPADPARRSAIAGIIGLAAGMALMPQIAGAASGDPVEAGLSNTCNGTTRITTSSGTGLHGKTTVLSGAAYGIQGESLSANGAGVYGVNMSTGTGAIGIIGQSISTTGVGVYGVNSITAGVTIGVRGRTNSPNGTSVKGEAFATQGSATGVSGESMAPGGYGVFGYAKANSGVNYGVYGQTLSPDGWAVHAQGRLRVAGRSFLNAPNTPPQLGPLPNSTISFWHDPAASSGAPNGLLVVQVKTSAGTVGRANIALSSA